MRTPGPETVARHLIDTLGGREKARLALDSEFQRIKDRWEQDTHKIGRILRAHLFVEYFLTEYLYAKNPNLGPSESARLTFSQKVALVDTSKCEIAYLIPGIRHLNIIRNRLAHSLKAEVTRDDANVFKQSHLFTAIRSQLAKEQNRRPSSEPIVVLEEFAMHAGYALQRGPATDAMAEAFRLAGLERTKSDASH
ncbi:MAG: hypothetical protein WCC37_03385, partial [Candidatus Sulfotelmatobacter sp.]